MQPRTYVASNGLDTNDGRLATPCRSIGAALAQTDPGGEIIVLDSAGYGTVVINKSVSVIAPPGIYAGITVTGGTGIDVTAGVVALRGLTIRGPGGMVGIHVGNATVRIDRCVISGLGQYGIHADTPPGEVHVRDTQVAQCAEGLRFDGAIRFSLERVRTEANTDIGLNVLNGAWGGAHDLVSVRNVNYGVGVATSRAGAACFLALDGAAIADNGTAGISAGIPAPVAARLLAHGHAKHSHRERRRRHRRVDAGRGIGDSGRLGLGDRRQRAARHRGHGRGRRRRRVRQPDHAQRRLRPRAGGWRDAQVGPGQHGRGQQRRRRADQRCGDRARGGVSPGDIHLVHMDIAG